MKDLLPAPGIDEMGIQMEAGAEAALPFFDAAKGDENPLTWTLIATLGGAVRGSVDAAQSSRMCSKPSRRSHP